MRCDLRVWQFVQDAQHQGQDHGRGVLKCHPFFTGSVKFVDAAGRVDKFNKKFQGTYGKAKKAGGHRRQDLARDRRHRDDGPRADTPDSARGPFCVVESFE